MEPTNYIRLTEDQCRQIASGLAPEYGSVVSTSEVCSRVFEQFPELYPEYNDAVHEATVDRIQELVRNAEVFVRFECDEHPAIKEITISAGEFDGVAIVEIITTDKAGTMSDGNPNIRVYVNDGQVYGDEPDNLFDPADEALYPFKLHNEQLIPEED